MPRQIRERLNRKGKLKVKELSKFKHFEFYFNTFRSYYGEEKVCFRGINILVKMATTGVYSKVKELFPDKCQHGLRL